MMTFSDDVVGKLKELLKDYSQDDKLTNLYQWPIDGALSKLSENPKSAQWANEIKNSSKSIPESVFVCHRSIITC
jgi:hypothetical protein